MKTVFRNALTALLVFASAGNTSAFDNVLPSTPTQVDGDLRLADDVKIGRFQGNKYTATPGGAQIKSGDSTDNASGLSAPQVDTSLIPRSGITANSTQIVDNIISLQSGQMLGRVAAGNVYLPGPASNIVQAESFGIPTNYSGDATSKFQAALNTVGVDTVTFCGQYIVNELVVPDNKRLEGCNTSKATLLATSSSSDFAVSVGNGSSLAGMTINGNNTVNKAVKIVGNYVTIEHVETQYADKCFYNESGNMSKLLFTGHANCHYGFYSADQWVNSLIYGHLGKNGSYSVGSGPDSYGFFFTYSTQQPQAVRIISSQAYGDAYGIWFEKDVFSVNLRDLVLDAININGITFNDVPCKTKDGPSDVYISGSFITGNNGAAIKIRPRSDRGVKCQTPVQSYNQVSITQNHLTANIGISAEANAMSRTASLNITGNVFGAGRQASTALNLDSVYGAWVMHNTFGIDPNNNVNPGGDIGVGATYTGTAYTSPINPPVQIRYNRFEKLGRRVSPFNTIVSDNIGGP
jgi:hypothetical protein